MYIPENDKILNEVLGAFDFPATLVGAVRYGQGHINDTFCVLCQPQEGDCIRFILQGLSIVVSALIPMTNSIALLHNRIIILNI